MQPERQISLALAMIGGALVIPEYARAARTPPSTPGVSLIVGAVLGALGIFGGCLMAMDYSPRSARVLRIGLWTTVGLAFTGALLIGAAHSTTWGLRVGMGAAALLPLVGPLFVFTRRDNA